MQYGTVSKAFLYLFDHWKRYQIVVIESIKVMLVISIEKGCKNYKSDDCGSQSAMTVPSLKESSNNLEN